MGSGNAAIIVKRSVVILRSNEVAPDPRVEKEARALFEAGWRVIILGWDRSASISDESRDYARIIRMHLRAPYGARWRNTPRKIRWNLWLLRWLVLHRSQYTHIHACDLDTAIPAIIVKLLFRKTVVYDIFDNIVLSAIAAQPAGVNPAVRAAARIIKCAENFVIRRADAVILVDESRKELLGAVPKRLEIIYNSPDALPPPQIEQPSDKTGLRIAYVGQLSLERGLLEMLEVLSRRPEFKLDLAGFGCDEECILKKARGLANVTWHGRVGYTTAIEISRGADVLFATYDPAVPLHRYSSANKLFEAMMLGKPIIVARNTGMDRIVEEHHIGIVVDYADPAQLEAALDYAMQMTTEERLGISTRSRAVYDTLYSSEIMNNRLVALYSALL